MTAWAVVSYCGLMKTSKTNTVTETKVVAAAVLGTLAFNAGMKRVPALDKNIKPLLAGNKIGEGIPVLNAWLKAWDDANLCSVPTLFIQIGEDAYAVTTMNEASAKFLKVMEQLGMGSREFAETFGEIKIVDADGKQHGYISYNGKVWAGSQREWESSSLIFSPYAE